jgi:hypothetical protein
MASFAYNIMAKQPLDAWKLTAVIKVRLVMTNTTVDTENDAKDQLSDFTTMDTHDGSGYVDKTLAGLNVLVDDANNRACLDCNDVTWTALGAGTRAIEGALVYEEVSASEAGRVPLCFIDPTNISSNGGDVTLAINASGLLAFSGTGAP